MATVIGTLKQGVFSGPGSGTTVNITNVTQDAGSGGYLYLILMHQNNYTPTATYNGASMTKFQSYSGQGIYWDIYELASPSTGSNTLTLTYTAFQEYGTNISYWIISTTGANGYGNIQTASGAAVSPGLNCNLSSVTTGSAVVLAATIPTPTSYNQTLTVDGSTRDYDSGGNTTPYTQQTGTSNRSTGWYKESVSTGNTNMISDSGFQMAGVAFEILAGATASLPTVTTTAVTNIGRLTASSGGNVTSDGGASVTARGVCWDVNTNPDINDSKTSNGTGTGSFSSSITGLTPGTVYYVRAYATNSEGTAYGSQESFTSKRRITITQ